MKKKVLIIEDDRDTLDILGYLAEELNLACELKTGVLTLPEIKAINPSLILLDYWLMDGDGGGLCRQIKEEPQLAGIKVVIMSAHPQLPRVAADNNADEFLPKPFDVDELEELIKRSIKID